MILTIKEEFNALATVTIKILQAHQKKTSMKFPFLIDISGDWAYLQCKADARIAAKLKVVAVVSCPW